MPCNKKSSNGNTGGLGRIISEAYRSTITESYRSTITESKEARLAARLAKIRASLKEDIPGSRAYYRKNEQGGGIC